LFPTDFIDSSESPSTDHRRSHRSRVGTLCSGPDNLDRTAPPRPRTVETKLTDPISDDEPHHRNVFSEPACRGSQRVGGWRCCSVLFAPIANLCRDRTKIRLLVSGLDGARRDRAAAYFDVRDSRNQTPGDRETRPMMSRSSLTSCLLKLAHRIVRDQFCARPWSELLFRGCLSRHPNLLTWALSLLPSDPSTRDLRGRRGAPRSPQRSGRRAGFLGRIPLSGVRIGRLKCARCGSRRSSLRVRSRQQTYISVTFMFVLSAVVGVCYRIC